MSKVFRAEISEWGLWSSNLGVTPNLGVSHGERFLLVNYGLGQQGPPHTQPQAQMQLWSGPWFPSPSSPVLCCPFTFGSLGPPGRHPITLLMLRHQAVERTQDQGSHRPGGWWLQLLYTYVTLGKLAPLSGPQN